MPNRLADAASPYLRQHADNPVDWWEWGEEAFAEARRRDVPVFLSVGYASCHWCHVMAHESFEDPEVARALDADFVAIKVDREERPDVDGVYMAAVQALTGHGGWPMSVFTDADGTPFFGGTYWPREDRHGMPGFPRVLAAIAQAWREDRDTVTDTARQLTERLRRLETLPAGSGVLDTTVADAAAALCVRAWDSERGGFGGAPKFPQAMTIDFLLAHAQRTAHDGALEAAAHSLEAMTRGGIYDHVGGGFARYATDADWLVPHFEKMLYDNALLLRTLAHAYALTGRTRFRRVAMETADYLLREMQDPGGGFYSSTDADSEGVEGKFFVWSDAEFREVVAAAGEDADRLAAFHDVTPYGNWEGTNILHEPVARDEDDPDFAAALTRAHEALYARREQRVHPGLDDKVLTSWTALAIEALADAGRLLGQPHYIEGAQKAAAFLRDHLVVDGRLLHVWREGHGARVPAFLGDVASLAVGLLALAEADGDLTWVRWARELADEAEANFADPDAPGTYFATAHDAEPLVTRPKDLWDNAEPSGASRMAELHLRLAALTGEASHAEAADRILAAFSPSAERAPTGFGELLRAVERRAGETLEVAIVGADDGARDLRAVYDEKWRPACVLAWSGAPAADDGAVVPLLADRGTLDGRAAAYVCHDFVCERPVSTPEELRALLP